MVAQTDNTVDSHRRVKGVYATRLRTTASLFTYSPSDRIQQQKGSPTTTVLSDSAPYVSVESLAHFLDVWAVQEYCVQTPHPQPGAITISVLSEIPEGTEYFSVAGWYEPIELSVNWDRWHELLDSRAQRPLTTIEEKEYEEYAQIAAKLDAEEAKTAEVAMDGLVKEHERVLDSIRSLTAAVRAAVGQA